MILFLGNHHNPSNSFNHICVFPLFQDVQNHFLCFIIVIFTITVSFVVTDGSDIFSDINQPQQLVISASVKSVLHEHFNYI